MFCFYYESKAGPIIQYIMTCGDYVFVKCEYSPYVEDKNVLWCLKHKINEKKGNSNLILNVDSRASMLLLKRS